MNRFAVNNLPLEGLRLIERKAVGDLRGFLARIFCANELAAAGWAKPIAQINHAGTVRAGTVRGMHYQRPPHVEMKLVSCIRGEVWDVAVDLRAGSDTFLRWHAERLSAENRRAMLIPEGFAHGFQALTDNVELLYLHSEPYVPEAEDGLNPRDSRLSIDWPLPIAALSSKDAEREWLGPGFEGIRV